MLPRFAKISEIAERFKVSADAVYLWIRQGKIPADCVVRIAGTVRVDEERFERSLRAGLLYYRGASNRAACGRSAPVAAEDNFTTEKTGLLTEHRWTSETGTVQPDHPYSPAMLAETKSRG